MNFYIIDSLTNGPRKDSGLVAGPNTKLWYERVSARPACKRGMERLQKEESSAKASL